MKKLFVLFSLTSLFGFSAQAAGRPWLSCLNENAMRTNVRIAVKVSTADFSGVTEVRVERTLLGRNPRPTVKTFIVRNESDPRRIGGNLVLRGNGIVLTTNTTTRPRPGGGRPGLLTLKSGGRVENIKLVCGR